MSQPTADDVILLLKQLIKLLGADALRHEDWTQFYSGPKDSILSALFGKTSKQITAARKNRSNYKKAERQAKRSSAIRIDDTAPGQFVGAIGVYKFFEVAYLPDIAKAYNEADNVMRFLSREFARSAQGHVITAVCGADKRRIFRDIELPELVLNPNIETINGIPIKTIRELYFSTPHAPATGHSNAFRLICLSELRMSLRRAWREASNEAVNDYVDRKAFFQIEHGHELQAAGKAVPAVYTLSRKERQMRRAILKLRIMGFTAAAPKRSAPAAKIVRLHR